MENNQKTKSSIFDRYEVVLMAISVLVIGIVVAGLTIFPEQGKEIGGNIMKMLTGTFGSAMQFITLGIIIFFSCYCVFKIWKYQTWS